MYVSTQEILLSKLQQVNVAAFEVCFCERPNRSLNLSYKLKLRYNEKQLDDTSK